MKLISTNMKSFLVVVLLLISSRAVQASVNKEIVFNAYLKALEKRGALDEGFKNDFLFKIKREENVIEKEDIKKVKLSRGELIVEEQKRKVREKIKQMRSKKEKSNKQVDIYESLNKWREEISQNYKDTLSTFAKERQQFLKRVPEIKKTALIEDDVYKEVKVLKKEIIYNDVKVPNDDHLIVEKIFDLRVKDQGLRPTCSAFATATMLENFSSDNKEFSEQYLYWASKPQCQDRKCSQAGSWIGYGLDYSKKQSRLDIPLKENCPYENRNDSLNQTQIPLNSGCNKGRAKVTSFEYLNSINLIFDEFKKQRLVHLSLKLSENFYENDGLVTLKEATATHRVDGHANGHAIVAYGVLPLPKKIKSSEGEYCVLVQNSWGAGWGIGGHACLTQKWLEKYRSQNPAVSITKVEF